MFFLLVGIIIRYNSNDNLHSKTEVVTMPALSSLVILEVVLRTAYGAANQIKVRIMGLLPDT